MPFIGREWRCIYKYKALCIDRIVMRDRISSTKEWWKDSRLAQEATDLPSDCRIQIGWDCGFFPVIGKNHRIRGKELRATWYRQL